MQPTPRSGPDLVSTARRLRREGVSRRQLSTELLAGRWRRDGLAVVLHNGPTSASQRHRVACEHAGPRSVLTAFTAAEVRGLTGWERREVHVLAAAGTRLRAGCRVPVRLHLTGRVVRRDRERYDVEFLPDALVRACATFEQPRPACGLLAAAVQQRLVDVTTLRESVNRATRVRHRAAMLAALDDIAGGAEALSEIDFARLCRRHGLPEPVRQQVRVESSGRRRYLDATWRRADGRLVVAEVDGALHLHPLRWWDDQSRQNELAIDNAVVLRFPAVVVRTDELEVARQLRRALLLDH